MPADMLPLLQWLGGVTAPFIIGLLVGAVMSRPKPYDSRRDMAFLKLEDMEASGVVLWKGRVYDCKRRPHPVAIHSDRGN